MVDSDGIYSSGLVSHVIGSRSSDYDQFLVNLLQPEKIRRPHAAIRALNVELARGTCVSK